MPRLEQEQGHVLLQIAPLLDEVPRAITIIIMLIIIIIIIIIITSIIIVSNSNS